MLVMMCFIARNIFGLSFLAELLKPLEFSKWWEQKSCLLLMRWLLDRPQVTYGGRPAASKSSHVRRWLELSSPESPAPGRGERLRSKESSVTNDLIKCADVIKSPSWKPKRKALGELQAGEHMAIQGECTVGEHGSSAAFSPIWPMPLFPLAVPEL